MNAQGILVREVPVKQSARVLQASGMFDVPASAVSRVEIPYNLPLDDKPWNIGLIVGASGSGKSSIAEAMWPEQTLVSGHDWDPDRAVVDGFPKRMAVKDVLDLLSSVGFSSPPAWLRPYHVLSTGEQFRVSIARTLAEAMVANEEAVITGGVEAETVVVDEFTSVVDRTVAQIGSSAIARTVRRRHMRFVAVTCHYDVLEWLQPDWVFNTDTSQFDWRSVQPRPSIELRIQRVHHSYWSVFSRHHYLSKDLNPSAVCFAAFLASTGRPVAFNAWLSQPHRSIPNMRRSSRVVTLPDYQGVGIGNRLVETCASLWRALNYRPMATAAHPAMVAHRQRSPVWVQHRDASRNSGGGMMTRDAIGKTIANARFTAGFEYVGPVMDKGVAEALYNTSTEV